MTGGTGYDFRVAVIGGGPAGSACAALLAQRGPDVLLVEKSAAPADKICGEFVCPQSLEILETIGALPAIEKEPHRKVSGMVLSSPAGHHVEAPFLPPGGGNSQVRHGISMPRRRFDGILQETACLHGAILWRGARLSTMEVGREGVNLILRREGETHRVRARLVVGADGRFSAVARLSSLSLPAEGRVRAVVHGYFAGVQGLGEMGETHFLPGGGYCSLDPMPDGTCNVSYVDDVETVLSWRHREVDLLRARIDENGFLKDKFLRAEATGPLRVLTPLQVRTRRPYAERVMLVGDAAGFYDPLTGEGIFAALKTASMAAAVAERAVAENDCSAGRLAAYGWMRARWIRPKMLVWRLFQQIIRRESLLSRFGAQMVRSPELARLLVGLTGNYVSPLAMLRPSVAAQIAKGLLPWPPHFMTLAGRGMGL